MRHFLSLLVILINFVICRGFSVELSDREKSSLKVFLQTFMEESELGYVFFNKKPVCTHGYESQDSFTVNTDYHKEIVALKEGANIWKKLSKNKDSEIIIHINQQHDPEFPNVFHLLVINVPLFHKVVNENLSLFKYILGPSLTSEGLLASLVDDDQPFHALLNYDKVLIGILLGFEIENSLLISRIENMNELEDKEYPPFLSAKKIIEKFNHEYLPFSVGYGHRNWKDEQEYYLKKVAVSSKKLTVEQPNFIFGYDKDLLSNKKVIVDLENVQSQIQDLMKLKNYEEIVLNKLTEHSYSLETKEVIHFEFDSFDVDKIIAKGLLVALAKEDPEYLKFFSEGLSTQNQETVNYEKTFCGLSLKEFIQSKENLKKAHEKFQSLSDNKIYQCIEPMKLYYKSLDTSKCTKEKCEGSLVSLTYSIYSPIGHCLAYKCDEVINLDNTISGFSQGVQGMNVGETRELFIHPSLAYGFNTESKDKCIYLKAIITLDKVHNRSSFKKLEPLDLDFISDFEELKVRQNKYKNWLKAKGSNISSHLSKSRFINLEKVREYFELLQKEQESIDITLVEQNIINHVHWDIYYNK